MTMAVTINGQLSLLMCIEAIYESLNNVEIIQENTDGATFIIDANDLKQFKKIVKDWEKTTNLQMEYGYPKKIFQRDVNNYIWDFEDYSKTKGAYEVDKFVGSEPALHKDNSNRVIRLAAREYFLNNTPIEDTIKNHDNIYDFCINKRMRRGWYFSYQANPISNDFKLKNIKTLRYYVSNTGGIIYKNNIDGRKAYLEAYPKGKENKGKYWKLKLFNKFKQKEDYNIDYSYYIREAKKLIKAIERHTIQD